MTRSAQATPSVAQRRATLSDVAHLAGVSRSVAGHVLNGGSGNSRVSAATADRIREAARKLDYRPNIAARTLRGMRSHSYGVLVASAGDPLRSFLVQYLDAEAIQHSCQVLIGNTLCDAKGFDRCVEQFARRGVDGVFCAVHHWFEGDRAGLMSRFPAVVFYEDPGVAGAPHVLVDREQGERLAVRHLVGRGRKRIGLAVGSSARPSHRARREGYLKEIRDHGLPVDERLIFDGEGCGKIFAAYNEGTKAWDFPFEVMDLVVDRLVVDRKADALVAHNDFWASVLIKRIHARGLRVPEDVAVVGYLNHYLADWTDPALTTLDLRHDEAARCMVSMLERIIAEGALPEEERVAWIQPRLVVRESA